MINLLLILQALFIMLFMAKKVLNLMLKHLFNSFFNTNKPNGSRGLSGVRVY